MFEIAPHYHLPIFRLLAFAVPAAATGVLLLYLTNRARLRRVVAALPSRASCARAPAQRSGARGVRGPARTAPGGWPRGVYARWVSWETAQRSEGVRWQGFVENTVFYAAAATLLAGLLMVERRPT